MENLHKVNRDNESRHNKNLHDENLHNGNPHNKNRCKKKLQRETILTLEPLEFITDAIDYIYLG